MAENSEKKIKIFNLAKELNLASDTIIEFLTRKGYKVKGVMATVDADMMQEIMTHFKKDKVVADRHHRKIAELKESRLSKAPQVEKALPGKKAAEPKKKEGEAELKGKLPQKKTAVEAPAPPKETVPPVEEETAPAVAAAPSTLTAVSETAVAEPAAPLQAETARAVPTEKGMPAATPSEGKAAPLQAKTQREEEGRAKSKAAPGAPAGTRGKRQKGKKEQEYISPLDRQIAEGKKKGLTIKGKIELAEAQTVPEKEGGARLPAEAEEQKRKKKKKRKVKEEKASEIHEPEVEGVVKKKKKKKRVRVHEVDVEQVDEAIRRTLSEMDESGISLRSAARRKRKRQREEEQARILEEQELEQGKLRVTEYVTVGELANLMGVSVSDVIAKCIGLGLMVSINQRLDKDNITLLADEFGFQVEFHEEFTVDALEDVPDAEETLRPRAPVVTIMGHVDHGKTSLLDYIRRTNVVAGEAGGITQHIGAYEVTLENRKNITFLDTPGHEAFTAMRARGAQLTDIVVLVVAAEDNVMPQTLEAISHARAANVPIIIAINKVDKPEANPDRIRQQLADKGVLVEEWGGKYQSVEVSARTGKNAELLLEKILLEAEILELKANPNRHARGAVVEAQLDKGKGILGTILIQKGTLRIGDSFIGGIYNGKVKAMFDERGNRVEAAGPSTPVQLLGFDGIPQAGDQFVVLDSERVAREISLKRQQLKREQDFRQIHFITLDDISKQIQAGQQVRELSLVVKGDVDGSVEALSDSLMKLSTDEVKVNVIHKGVGAISETDVLLAAASSAIIIGFNVRPNLNARRLAEKESVDIRIHNIIYNAIDEVRDALEGLLAPTVTEEVTATVEVREIFKVPKVGTVAGCYVTDGTFARNNKIRLVRDGVAVFEGTIASLKRFKEDAREVEQGFECGVSLENFNDIKVGDVIEAFKIVETKRTL
ncbi:MAG: translation initiation factor IF-2 [Bacteroidota bacterium]|nr:translation initiation factor IF-2 [Bacteroidota bacterium]